MKNTDGGYITEVAHIRETNCPEHSVFLKKDSHIYSGPSGDDSNICSLCGAVEYFRIRSDNLTYYVESGESITLPPLPEGCVFWGINDSLKEENTVFSPTAEENSASGFVSEEGIRADVLLTSRSSAEGKGYVIYSKRWCEACGIHYSGDKCPSPYTYGQIVYYGKYPESHELEYLRGQRVPWYVVKIDHDKSVMMVVSKDVLEHRSWNESSSPKWGGSGSYYGGSDLQWYLNSDFLSDYSLGDAAICNVYAGAGFSETDVIVGSGRDWVFLLSAYETGYLEQLPTSTVAYYDGHPCMYVLRTYPGMDYELYTVGHHGRLEAIQFGTFPVAVRPAFYVKYLE